MSGQIKTRNRKLIQRSAVKEEYIGSPIQGAMCCNLSSRKLVLMAVITGCEHPWQCGSSTGTEGPGKIHAMGSSPTDGSLNAITAGVLII